ncbi:MAG: hypothetical protein IH991_00485 [Planctomycetes bacterium]|nr:hypothetical protein [Planctomycetota bacterium]
MHSVVMALSFVLLVAVANFVLGFAVAAKLGVGPKSWGSICAALRPREDDLLSFSSRENLDSPEGSEFDDHAGSVSSSSIRQEINSES